MKNRKGTDLFIWYRLGDNGDYHHVGNDINALADVLHEADIGGNIKRYGSGISSDNYRGDNYISLYWGDKKTGEHDVELITRDELEDIVTKLEERQRDHETHRPSPQA